MALAEPPLAQATAAVQLQQSLPLLGRPITLPPPRCAADSTARPSHRSRLRTHRADTSVGKLRVHLSAWPHAFQAVPGGTLSLSIKQAHLSRRSESCATGSAPRDVGSSAEFVGETVGFEAVRPWHREVSRGLPEGHAGGMRFIYEAAGLRTAGLCVVGGVLPDAGGRTRCRSSCSA